jgi:hypothetical protein
MNRLFIFFFLSHIAFFSIAKKIYPNTEKPIFIKTKIHTSISGVLPEYQSLSLDSTAEISLLTCDPGNEVYSTFGHSAILIIDTLKNINKVYNYGTFSFEEDFIYKFVKGDLDYYLSIDNLNGFINQYIYEKRGITQQKLNLSFQEKLKLYNFLKENYKPENRTYRYDFLFDNCTTRIRDALENATDHKIKYDYTFIREKKTYRDLIASKSGHLKWLTYGMDLMLGMPCDKTASEREHLFLPENLMTAYFLATINHDGVEENLVKSTNVLLDIPITKDATPFYLSPLFIFSTLAIFIILITFFEYKQNKWYKTIDIIFYLILVFIGFLFIFMWTSTRHAVAHQNMGLVFANPFLLILIILILLNKFNIIKYFSAFDTLCVFILIITWHWLFPQDFNIGLLPLFIVLLVRSAYIYYYSSKKKYATT